MERHPLRLSYLVTGLVFVAVAILGLADAWQFRAVDLAWVGPGLLVIVGVALVVGTAMRRDQPDAGPVSPDADAASGDAGAMSTDAVVDEQTPRS